VTNRTYNKTDFQSAKNRISQIASLMIGEKINLIEGCHQLARLRLTLGPDMDDLFNYFVSVSSETDHFPLGTLRKHCAQEFLKRADREMERYLLDEKERIMQECHQLVKKLSGPRILNN